MSYFTILRPLLKNESGDYTGKYYYAILRPFMATDLVPMELDVNYSTTKLTTEDVTVEIKSNKEIREVEGWTLSSDKKSMTKTYRENTTETITI